MKKNEKNKELSIEVKRSIPAKKLPRLFRKSYSEKQKAKLLSKIYIPSDKSLVDSMLIKGMNKKNAELYSADMSVFYSKKEIKNLKQLASQIKSQKGPFRLLPLVSAILFLVIIGILAGTFKNPLLKKAVVSASQGIFGAKCEVSSLDFKFFDSSLTINGYKVGNKDSVMKNLFEVEKIQLDFNLVHLLRGRFHAENLEASGISWNTDRTSSCELPAKEIKKEKKQNEESAFMKSIKEKSLKALEDLKSQTVLLLGGDDPESIVENVKSMMQTPSALSSINEELPPLVEKWKNKPSEIENEVKEFSDSVHELQTLKVETIKDASSLQSSLEKINKAITDGNKIKSDLEKVKSDMKNDGERVKNLSDNFSSALEADKKIAEEKLTSVTAAISNAKEIFTNALDSLAYSILGKFYPYGRKLISKALELKESAMLSKSSSSSAEKTEKSEKKQVKVSRERQKGKTFWYSQEYPAFLIENLYVSGTGFEAHACELTNDQDVRGKVTQISGNFNNSGLYHSAQAVLDIRSSSTDPLIALSYEGSGFPLLVDGSKIAEKSGVPSVDGKARVSLKGQAGEEKFIASGNVELDPVSFTSDGFENEILTKYYQSSLSSIDDLSLGYNIEYSEGSGIDLGFSGNYAQQFASALAKTASQAGNDAKQAALAKINEEIEKNQSSALAEIKKYSILEKDILSSEESFSLVSKNLEAKKAEIEKQIKAQAENKAKSAIKSGVNSLLKK